LEFSQTDKSFFFFIKGFKMKIIFLLSLLYTTGVWAEACIVKGQVDPSTGLVNKIVMSTCLSDANYARIGNQTDDGIMYAYIGRGNRLNAVVSSVVNKIEYRIFYFSEKGNF